MKRDFKFYFVLVISIVCLAAMLTVKEFQNDTFYTIKVGEQIVKTGIDMKEHFSWISGLSYTYPHWLYDVFIYFIYSWFGFTGIYVSVIFLTAILLFVMYFTTNKIIDDKGLSYSIVIFLGFTLKDFITARAQLVSYILFLLILYSIEMLREKGKNRYIAYIFLCSLFIANCHCAVWPFIFVLFLPYLVSDFVYFLKEKFKNKIDLYKKSKNLDDSRIEVEVASHSKKTIIAMLFVIITGFLTPNRFVPFTYFIKSKMGITLSYIAEHLPTTIEKRPELFVILAIVVFILLQSNMKIKLKDLFFIGGLSFLALLSKRNYSLFAILSVFSIARIFKLFVSRRLKSFRVEDVFKENCIFITMILLFFISSFFIVGKESQREYVNSAKYPVDLSSFILNNLDVENIRIYNEYNFGSYFMFRGIPVFIDSRADLYTEEFNPFCTVFQDGVVNIFKRYDMIFDKYGVTHVAIYNSNKLKIVLSLDNHYKPIYVDEYFTLYEKLT